MIAAAAVLLMAGCGGSVTAGKAAGGKDVVSIAPTTTATCVPAPATATAAPGAPVDLRREPTVVPPPGPPPCSLQTIDLLVGKGRVAVDGAPVAVKYVGLLYKGGTEFDSSWKRSPQETLPFAIGSGVIPGFSNGTKGMRVGGRREILIPSKDGYGPDGTGPIPPNADLIFVVDLVKVGRAG